MAGITPSSVKIWLNGVKLDIKNFSNYIDMYIDTVEIGEGEEPIKRVYEKPNENWEVN